jgi:predicted transcriptional regulator
MRIDYINSSKNQITDRDRMSTTKEIEDIIEYLANQSEKKNIEKNSDVKDSNTNFIELKSKTNERGMGCEAMNKCSGKGTCNNGSCLCDEGYDYFDCSVNVLSM